MAVTIDHMEAEEVAPPSASATPRAAAPFASPNSEDARRAEARIRQRAAERVWRRGAD